MYMDQWNSCNDAKKVSLDVRCVKEIIYKCNCNLERDIRYSQTAEITGLILKELSTPTSPKTPFSPNLSVDEEKTQLNLNPKGQFKEQFTVACNLNMGHSTCFVTESDKTAIIVKKSTGAKIEKTGY